MLVSHSKNFIFLHNYKVAGSSVKRALNRYSLSNTSDLHRLNDYLSKSSLPVAKGLNLINRSLRLRPTLNHHASAREIQSFMPDKVWDNYYKFGFVRNPWDWQVSMYHFMRTKRDHFQHTLAVGFNCFEEYLEWRVSADLQLQQDFFKDKNGRITVNFIGKLETINKDFKHICQQLGISCDLPCVNRIKHQNYREHYNQHTRELVAKHFAEDIEYFGYEF